MHGSGHGRWRLGGVVAVAMLVLGIAATGCTLVTPPPPTTLTISTAPGLFPAFNPSVTDYVTRCDPNTPVQVSIGAPSGTAVSVNGQPWGTGMFSEAVSLAEGQGLSIYVLPPSQPVSTYHVRCLPADYPAWNVQTSGQTQADGYMTIPLQLGGSSSHPTIFDSNGVPIWWGPNTPTIFTTLLPDGNMAWIGTSGNLEEHQLNGTLVRTIHPAVTSPTNTAGVGDPHDLLLLTSGADSGDYVFVTTTMRPNVDLSGVCNAAHTQCGPASANVADPVIEVLTPMGSLVWSWDALDHIPVTEMDPQWFNQYVAGGPSTPQGYDVYHWNSIEYNNSGGFVVSYRHLDAVYNVDQGSNAVLWKLGGSTRAESLTVENDPVFANSSHFGGQHDARLLSDGTVSLYDDGSYLGRAPRAVRYHIDTTARTATLVEALQDPVALSSFCCGSARKLPGGDWVMGWGGTNTGSETGVQGSGQVQLLHTSFLLQFPSNFLVYRMVPIPAGQLDKAALRAAMDQQYASTSQAHVQTAPTTHSASSF